MEDYSKIEGLTDELTLSIKTPASKEMLEKMDKRRQEFFRQDIARLEKMDKKGIAMAKVVGDAKYGEGDYLSADVGEAPQGN